MLHTTSRRKDGTPASIELFVVFEDHHGSNHRVTRRTTVAQHCLARCQALTEPTLSRSNPPRTEFLRHDATGTAVHSQDGGSGSPDSGGRPVSQHAPV